MPTRPDLGSRQPNLDLARSDLVLASRPWHEAVGGVAEGGSAAFMRDGGGAWSRRRQPARGREKGRCERLAVGRGVWRRQMDLRGAGKGGEGEMEAD